VQSEQQAQLDHRGKLARQDHKVHKVFKDLLAQLAQLVRLELVSSQSHLTLHLQVQ